MRITVVGAILIIAGVIGLVLILKSLDNKNEGPEADQTKLKA